MFCLLRRIRCKALTTATNTRVDYRYSYIVLHCFGYIRLGYRNSIRNIDSIRYVNWVWHGYLNLDLDLHWVRLWNSDRDIYPHFDRHVERDVDRVGYGNRDLVGFRNFYWNINRDIDWDCNRNCIWYVYLDRHRVWDINRDFDRDIDLDFH